MPVVSGLDLTDVELAEFREVFKLVDKDGSGEIDAGEVRELMRMLGMTPTVGEIEALVKEIDLDGNGVVDFEEFLLVMVGGRQKGGYDKKSLLRGFRVFADKKMPNGFITPETLEAALVDHCRDGLTLDAAASLVAQLERDTNGNINYLEKVNSFCN